MNKFIIQGVLRFKIKIIILLIIGTIFLTAIAGYIFVIFNNDNFNKEIDPNDLRILLKEYPDIPVKKLRKVWELTDSNAGVTDYWIPYSRPYISDANSGYKIQWGPYGGPISYYLIDGDIAWTYIFLTDPNLLEPQVRSEKVDAKEFDPKYRKIIKDAEIEAALKMQEKRVRELGSIHSFWIWKREYLKQKGIDWKSPMDLNKNTWYD